MFGVSKTRFVIRLFENLKMFFDGMGWDGMGGGWGGTEDQMGPSNFIILSGYIVYVYINMYTFSKFVTNFVMSLKI